jgi:hypothetical protein
VTGEQDARIFSKPEAAQAAADRLNQKASSAIGEGIAVSPQASITAALKLRLRSAVPHGRTPESRPTR